VVAEDSASGKYRLPFGLSGAPLFNVVPRFSELRLGGTEPRWLVHGLGWTYHFSNCAALGIWFRVMRSCFRRPMLFWDAVASAMFVDAMFLLTAYASFFGLKVNGRFLFLPSASDIAFQRSPFGSAANLVAGLWSGGT
jgi:hypothetical protein